MPKKPTILFVPGAWHSEFHARPVLPYFERLGYDVKVLVLANLGLHEDKDKKPGFRESIVEVFEAIKAQAKTGGNFVMMGHSAGGLVTGMAVNDFLTSATAEERSKLKHIIFVASFIHTSRHVISHWHHMDWEKKLSWPLRPEEIFYNDMSVEDSKPYCDALQPMQLSPRPDYIDDLWHQILRTFIVALRDNAISPHMQRLEAQEQGMDVVELDSDHCPFISQPENFANVVDGILDKQVVAKM